MIDGLKWLGAATLACVLVMGMLAVWGALTFIFYGLGILVLIWGSVSFLTWRIRKRFSKR